jgi:inhibitor of cysteine peptidase
MKQQMTVSRFTLLLLAISLIGAACAPAAAPAGPSDSELPTPSAGGASESPLPEPGDDVIVGEALVESIELLMLESFPLQVNVIVRGSLNDACTSLGEVTQVRRGSRIHLNVSTVRPADRVCAQVLAPFEKTFSLDVHGLPAGKYTVDVNGVTETFELAVDNILPEDQTAEQVTWEEAEALILSGEVEMIFQAHSLEVRLRLKDGRELVTEEPSIDEVFRVVDRCGEKCAGIAMATE